MGRRNERIRVVIEEVIYLIDQNLTISPPDSKGFLDDGNKARAEGCIQGDFAIRQERTKEVKSWEERCYRHGFDGQWVSMQQVLSETYRNIATYKLIKSKGQWVWRELVHG